MSLIDEADVELKWGRRMGVRGLGVGGWGLGVGGWGLKGCRA
jgi:hypothetical protein